MCGGGVFSMEWSEGVKWDNCNSIINKIYFFKKKKVICAMESSEEQGQGRKGLG